MKLVQNQDPESPIKVKKSEKKSKSTNKTSQHPKKAVKEENSITKSK